MRAGASRSERSALHGQVAAGKLTDIAFDDEMKRFVVSAKNQRRRAVESHRGRLHLANRRRRRRGG